MINRILADYQVEQQAYDELLDGDGQARAHWKTFLEHFASEDPRMMAQRLNSVQRQIRENGVTYNVYDDSMGVQRPWDLNVLPLILPSHEWATIEEAITQRATLLNRILVDVYGDQHLLKDGLLHPSLVFDNAGFLRPCCDTSHRDGIALHFYAVDLARSPDGSWWVIADRTQAPSGAGYALENRLIISRAFPDLFRDLKIRHLSNFFTTMRDSLIHWGRSCARNNNAILDANFLPDTEQPLVVLLTPGPYNETYHEQSFLARHLGFPLVQGDDLTVRGGMVWLKTLSGLRRVHVIMRRVDDDFCDPLELRSDSTLGVVGLVDAARRGTVIVTNHLGSNLLESGALLGYLPSLCEHLLGEELKMPSVATWWCGEPAALEEVIERLDELIIKPSFSQLRQFPVFGKDLVGNARENFIQEMRANPQNYVAQELVKLSKAPVWQTDPSQKLSACATGLRVYACATPHGYVVMPGGLTRVASGSDARVINMQRGGSSKDTWVQADYYLESHAVARHKTTKEDLVRGDTYLSSRMAENLYWFGRYAERCDNVARLTRLALDFLLHIPPEYRGGEWRTVQAVCNYFRLIELPEKSGPFILSDSQMEATLLNAVVFSDVPGVAKQQQRLYLIGCDLRERLSMDNWRTLNKIAHNGLVGAPTPYLSDAITILDGVVSTLMTISGFTLDGMTRDKGWRFLSIGRRIERLQFQCIVIGHALYMKHDGSLNWLLELFDSIITYRSRYMSEPEWLPVLDLLLLDDSNPRSLIFQLNGLIDYLKRMAETCGPCRETCLDQIRIELLSLAVDTDLTCKSPRLIDLLKRLHVVSEELSEYLGLRFFSYTDTHKI